MSGYTDIYDQIAALFSQKLNLEVPSMDADLVETGLLDSLIFVELLQHLEVEFGRKIPIENLEIDNFRSIAKIAEFVINNNRRFKSSL